jgi:CheY-like chemotaxis protein
MADILIVDDDPQLLRLLASGEQALGRLAAQTPDLVSPTCA